MAFATHGGIPRKMSRLMSPGISPVEVYAGVASGITSQQLQKEAIAATSDVTAIPIIAEVGHPV